MAADMCSISGEISLVHYAYCFGMGANVAWTLTTTIPLTPLIIWTLFWHQLAYIVTILGGR